MSESGSADRPDLALRRLVERGRAVFPAFELRHLARTPSTQDVVRAAARAGAEPGFCCRADEQTAGRGRQGRAWSAPAESALLMSVLLRPRGAVAALPLAAGLAAVDAIRTSSGVETRLKWPNDVVAGAGKLAGILAEVEPLAPPGPGPAVILGVGVNLRVEAFAEGVAGASLHRLVAPRQPPSPDGLLADLLEALGRRVTQLEHGGAAAIAADWRALAVGLGQQVVAVTPGSTVTGTAIDIDDEGALLVGLEDGTTRRLLAAEVHLV